MQDFDRQGGLAFLLVHFTEYHEYYLLPVETLAEYYLHKEEKGRSSIPYSAFEEQYRIPETGSAYLNYLAVALKYGKMKEASRKDLPSA